MPNFFSDTWAQQFFDSTMGDYFGKLYSNYAWTPEEGPKSQTFKRNPEPRKGYLDARNDIVPCVTSLGPAQRMEVALPDLQQVPTEWYAKNFVRRRV